MRSGCHKPNSRSAGFHSGRLIPVRSGMESSDHRYMSANPHAMTLPVLANTERSPGPHEREQKRQEQRGVQQIVVGQRHDPQRQRHEQIREHRQRRSFPTGNGGLDDVRSDARDAPLPRSRTRTPPPPPPPPFHRSRTRMRTRRRDHSAPPARARVVSSFERRGRRRFVVVGGVQPDESRRESAPPTARSASSSSSSVGVIRA